MLTLSLIVSGCGVALVAKLYEVRHRIKVGPRHHFGFKRAGR